MATMTRRLDADRWLLAKRWTDGQLDFDRDDHLRIERLDADARRVLDDLHDRADTLGAIAAAEAEDRFGAFAFADLLHPRIQAGTEYATLRFDTLYAALKEQWVQAAYDLLTRIEGDPRVD